MNMHRTHFLALAALAAALTLSALACRPETNAPATAASEVVTVEVTRLVAPGETAPAATTTTIALDLLPDCPTDALAAASGTTLSLIHISEPTRPY